MVGVVLTIQIRSIRIAKKEETRRDAIKLQELNQQLTSLEKEMQVLKEEYEINNSKYLELLNELAKNDSSFYETLKTYHDNISEMKDNAGLTEVTGSGIVVTLSDSLVAGDEYTSGSLVHDTTILSIVNQLKLAGATAISVNDERILAMSEFICVGPAVKVNDTKLFAPYVIKAIGNKVMLETAIKNSNAVTNANVNINISVEVQNEVTVPAYNKNYQNSINLLKNFEG